MLALWEYFWTETDWTAAPAPSPTPAPTPAPTGKGSGASRKRDYTSPDADFWEVRERYLRRFAPSLPEAIKTAEVITNDNLPVAAPSRSMEAPPPGGALLLLQQAFTAATGAAQRAINAAQLRDATQRAHALALDISKVQQQYADQATAILLLDIF